MQDIYTMIMNHGVTFVIVVIFLYQYVVNIKHENDRVDKEFNEKKQIYEKFIESVSSKLDKLIVLAEKILDKLGK